MHGVVSQTTVFSGNWTHDYHANSLAHYPIDYSFVIRVVVIIFYKISIGFVLDQWNTLILLSSHHFLVRFDVYFKVNVLLEYV